MAYAPPKPHGLYDPRFEHDACGIGAIVNISGRREHAIIDYGKEVLLKLQHRGAAGADECTGDGAGILFQIPHEFFAAEAEQVGVRGWGLGAGDGGSGFRVQGSGFRVQSSGFRGQGIEGAISTEDSNKNPEPRTLNPEPTTLAPSPQPLAPLPPPAYYGVGMVFLPQDAEVRRGCVETLTEAIAGGGLSVLGWREVPTDDTCLGDLARAAEPVIRQVFIDGQGLADEELERRLFVVRKRAEHRIREVQ